jgi:hypothetical protein
MIHDPKRIKTISFSKYGQVLECMWYLVFLIIAVVIGKTWMLKPELHGVNEPRLAPYFTLNLVDKVRNIL